MYEVRLTREAHAFYQNADEALARRLNRCFSRLAEDPRGHPNSKRLRGPLAGYWRYRLGGWRVVYRVEEEDRAVTVMLIARRSEAYR
jgi:mRNA interferase RelE/StbE